MPPGTEEYLFEAREELKRLEHIIYVSLKYTRTADVLTNALNRLVSIFDLIIYALLEQAREQNMMEIIPKSPAFCATKLAELYPEDQELQNYLRFYAFLRNILNLPSTKREEYRRHVTIVVELDKATAEIDIDSLENCEKFIHQFFHYAARKITGIVPE